MELHFTIKLNPITKKNSQQIIRINNRPMIIPSKQYKQYESDASYFLRYHGKPIDQPCEIECLFYMKTRRAVDLTNLLEAIDDILQKCQIIKDDSCKVLVSHDGSRVLYDPKNPRTEIRIKTLEEAAQ